VGGSHATSLTPCMPGISHTLSSMDAGSKCLVNDPLYGAVHTVTFVLIALTRVNSTQVKLWSPVDNFPFIN